MNARLVGVYTIVIALLLFSHLTYIKDNSLKGKEIFRETYNNISSAYDSDVEPISPLFTSPIITRSFDLQ